MSPIRILPFVVALVACGPDDPGPPPESPRPSAPPPAAAPPSAGPDLGAVAPSFDCAEPASTVEERICTDPELARLDLRLDSVFQAALAVALQAPGDDGSTLRAYQRGWIGGRDECWKSDDVGACVADAYRRRTAELQAEYALVQAGDPIFFFCEDEPANEFVLTEFATEPAAARIERGDRTVIGIRVPAPSGVRYEAPFGVSFWSRGEEATVVWPEGTIWSCARRTGGGLRR